MHLIYSRSAAAARAFAHDEALMPGDWKWIQDADTVRQYPRAHISKLPRWQENPHRAWIDVALQRAADAHRLGPLTDLETGGETLGISGA
ncbi:hypothetical protein [Marilutibacter aestuarii]|uniref:Uncharacterized protein n=1 Tax=Marilutibacter aestuarii TaxID=1706195 RepID=A0A508AE11_9GAMM|nr:hypothetical protein [Lysobacter aestuarii]TQD45295.1 hypothetical protein FKV25_08460 [Lysobacter aestuarii]